jgi:hypothetical protein
MDQEKRIRFLPLLVTLIAAALTALINLILQVEFAVFFKRIFFSIIIFYVIGCIVQIVFRIALEKKDDVGILESEAEESNAEDSENSSSEDDEDEDE